MSLHYIYKRLHEAPEYADCAVIHLYAKSDIFADVPEAFYAECGTEKYAVPLCSSMHSQCLESAKNAVIRWLNDHPRFFIFDCEAIQEYDNVSPLEEFIQEGLKASSYSRNFTEKQDISAVVEGVFFSIRPTSPSDLGLMGCALL